MTTIDKTKGKEKLSFKQNTTPIAESLRKPDTTMDDKISTAILKTTIKAIPLLTQENFTLWRSRVENMLDPYRTFAKTSPKKKVLTLLYTRMSSITITKRTLKRSGRQSLITLPPLKTPIASSVMLESKSNPTFWPT
ncbi:uncharacterized protein VP01_7654g2 [Puccinia sorghi]|uniref:Uncharacterized protein n=1 Tax=Puccinia sorghi TaxID=27349 RepID=A0A0L6UBQ2_9BASI|nr:uncharacterized protein VP01_7654g2 [Puccinia sorghi]